MAKTYRGIVIGCGQIGAKWTTRAGRISPRSHAAALTRNPKTSLAALVDADPACLNEAGKLFPRALLYKNAHEALKKEKPDIVVVATPPKTHAALVALAVASGVKMIICEKPLAPSAKEAAALAQVLKKSRSVVAVNFQRRFWPLVNTVREDITARKLGKIQHVSAYYDNGLYNTGAHALDTILFLLSDDASQALAFPGNARTHPPNDPDVDGIIETKKGTHITLQGLDKKFYGLLEIKILGTKGAVTLTDLGYTVERFSPGRYHTMPTLVSAGKTHKTESFVAGVHKEAIVCYEKKQEPKSSLASSIKVLAALDALVKSAKTGKAERVIIPKYK